MKRLLSLLCIWLLSCASAIASPLFDQGVSLYNDGKYSEALQALQQNIIAEPNDSLSHYYAGLSLHCLGQLQAAYAEYAWLAQNCPDPVLQKRARFGIHALTQAGINPLQGWSTSNYARDQSPGLYQQTAVAQMPLSNSQPPLAPSFAARQTPGQDASQAAQYQQIPVDLRGASNTQNLPRQGSSLPRVIDFYTTWCGWCRRFEPFFQQAQAKYGSQISFIRANAEAPEYANIVRTYQVTGFPTLLYFDANGKLVKRHNGAPLSLQDFEADLYAAFPNLHQ